MQVSFFSYNKIITIYYLFLQNSSLFFILYLFI